MNSLGGGMLLLISFVGIQDGLSQSHQSVSILVGIWT
jgi:hypothetical protein